MKFERQIGECWAAHHVFLQLGFSNEALFVEITEKRPVVMGVVLRAGEKRATILCGQVDASRDEVAAEWTRFVTEDLPTLPEAKLQEFWERSQPARQGYLPVAIWITRQGIRVPVFPDLEVIS